MENVVTPQGSDWKSTYVYFHVSSRTIAFLGAFYGLRLIPVRPLGEEIMLQANSKLAEQNIHYYNFFNTFFIRIAPDKGCVVTLYCLFFMLF